MSRPANPYDNASCESFMKTLKREEIYANNYRDLEHLRKNLEAFIQQYYNRHRLHSALGGRAPEEFEQALACLNAAYPYGVYIHIEGWIEDAKLLQINHKIDRMPLSAIGYLYPIEALKND